MAPPGGLTAGDVQQRAVDRGDPQVGGARVEHHGEDLRRRAQPDLAVVLGLDHKHTLVRLAEPERTTTQVHRRESERVTREDFPPSGETEQINPLPLLQEV